MLGNQKKKNNYQVAKIYMNEKIIKQTTQMTYIPIKKYK